MAEHEHDTPEKKDPPKIKLPGLQSMADFAAKEPAPAGPPKAKPDAPPPSGKTSRIEVSQARPAAGIPSPGKTSRIDLADAHPAPSPGAPVVKKQTSRIPLDAAKPVSPDEAMARKHQTTRIDITQARPPPAAGPAVIEGLPRSLDDHLKRSTVRIDQPPGRPVPPPPPGIIEAEIPEAAKNVTQRIVLEDEAPTRDTTRLDTKAIQDAAAVQETKKRTSRIDLSGATMRIDQDVLQRRVPPPAPVTAPPITMPAAEPPGPRPKTIRISKAQVAAPRAPAPAPEPAVSAPPPAREILEAKKSETARLDLPPEITERPATRPKTIRIKRPDAAPGRKPMAVARAAEPAPAARAAAAEEEEGGDTLSAVLALVATLVVLVLIYVLAAQIPTIGAGHYDLPSWPFPGRLPG